MAELWELSASEAAGKIATGEITSEALVASCLARIAERDDAVRAWAFLDPDHALEQACDADAALSLGYGVGPLHGVPVGIKDIIETAEMPTQNGYGPHEGRKTGRDAFCVGQLRDAGAVILGKTITTELAAREPRGTRNPLNPAHTPGGSSSGSAAAVRDGQAPLALGTQTGGSVIRPASFCGVHGFKPTFGLIGRTGVTLQADWLDTVGVYGRSIADLALITAAMLARDPEDPQAHARSRPPLPRFAAETPSVRPKLAFWRTPKWDKADSAARLAMEEFASSLGTDCTEVDLPVWLSEAWDWQRVLQSYGNALHYGPLADAHGDAMSQSLRDTIADGRSMSEATYRHAVEKRTEVRSALDEVFESFDAILCLASAGPAPKGLDWTGDPVFNAFWTYAGTPCITLPLLEIDGMPMGVQLVGRPGADGPLLRNARWLENQVS